MSQSNRKTPEDKAVEEMQGFLQHLGAYAIVIGMLFVINLVTSRDSWWFLWVAFFWGIGLAFQTQTTVFSPEQLGVLTRDRSLLRERAANASRIGSGVAEPIAG